MKIKKKRIINIAWRQGVLFNKFNESEKYMEKMKKLK